MEWVARRGEGRGRTVHVFSTSTQPRWRRIAAQCSSNGAVLRRDHAAAPCTTDHPISGTRDSLSFTVISPLFDRPTPARTCCVHPRALSSRSNRERSVSSEGPIASRARPTETRLYLAGTLSSSARLSFCAVSCARERTALSTSCRLATWRK